MNPLDLIGKLLRERPLALSAAVLGALLLILSAAYFVWFRTPYGELFSHLRPMDAATIVAELEKKKIPYRLDAGGTVILVPKDKIDAVRLDVMSQDLPIKGMVGFELFNKSDMGLTEFAQKINYQRALQGELARTIMTLEAVDTARVHLSMPESSVFRDDRKPPKASVTLTSKPGRSLSVDMVRGVQRLVAAAVTDLDADHVVILDDQGRIVSPPPAPAAQAIAGSSLQAGIQQFYEARVKAAIERTYADSGVEIHVTAGRLANADPADGASGNDAAFEGWTPSTRRFRLVVDINLAASISSTQLGDIRAVVDEAINFDPSLGDVITIEVAPSEASAPRSSPATAIEAGTSARPMPHAAHPKDATGMVIAALMAVVGAVSALGAWLLARHVANRPMSPVQRARYAQRLSRLIDEEGGHAPV